MTGKTRLNNMTSKTPWMNCWQVVAAIGSWGLGRSPRTPYAPPMTIMQLLLTLSKLSNNKCSNSTLQATTTQCHAAIASATAVRVSWLRLHAGSQHPSHRLAALAALPRRAGTPARTVTTTTTTVRQPRSRPCHVMSCHAMMAALAAPARRLQYAMPCPAAQRHITQRHKTQQRTGHSNYVAHGPPRMLPRGA